MLCLWWFVVFLEVWALQVGWLFGVVSRFCSWLCCVVFGCLVGLVAFGFRVACGLVGLDYCGGLDWLCGDFLVVVWYRISGSGGLVLMVLVLCTFSFVDFRAARWFGGVSVLRFWVCCLRVLLVLGFDGLGGLCCDGLWLMLRGFVL